MLVSRLPRAGKKFCLVVGQLLMLYINWLVFRGSLDQAIINWDVQAPVTGASMAIFYGVGVVFAVSATALLLRDIWRVISGRISDEDLIMVKESEEAGELEALQAELARGGDVLPGAVKAGSRP
jgi:TRAP-type C4-dicarboxylate transport system permease small subunit